MVVSLTDGCLPLLLLGSSHPNHATRMPNISGLLSDAGVIDVNNDDDETMMFLSK